MICMKKLRFSSCLRAKVRCQGPLGRAQGPLLEHSPDNNNSNNNNNNNNNNNSNNNVH